MVPPERLVTELNISLNESLQLLFLSSNQCLFFYCSRYKSSSQFLPLIFLCLSKVYLPTKSLLADEIVRSYTLDVSYT